MLSKYIKNQEKSILSKRLPEPRFWALFPIEHKISLILFRERERERENRIE